MTEVDIARSLEICYSEQTCEGCLYKENGSCKSAIMKDAASVIKTQKKAIEGLNQANKRLEDANEQIQQMAKVNYTKEQLVEAVNQILNSFTHYNEEENCLEAQLHAIGSFMRLCCIHGHIGVSTRVERIEIVMDK